MRDDRLSRRQFIATCGALVSAWITADATTLRAAASHVTRARTQRSHRWVTLDSEQAADIEAMCAVIIPSDATPGASEAGVVHFVDHAIATWAAFQREAILHGLADLNAQARARWPGSGRFATLSPEQQIAMVRHAEPTPFFWAIRFLTIVGMFALPEYGGNSEKAGWRLIGFDDRYRWQPPFGAYDGERVTSSR